MKLDLKEVIGTNTAERTINQGSRLLVVPSHQVKHCYSTIDYIIQFPLEGKEHVIIVSHSFSAGNLDRIKMTWHLACN